MSKLEVEDDQVTKDWELKCCVLWCRNEALGKEHLQNRVSGFFFLCSHCFGNNKKKSFQSHLGYITVGAYTRFGSLGCANHPTAV